MAAAYYICDGKACGENHECGACRHTSQIEHAVNFEPSQNKNSKKFFEKMPGEDKESSRTGEAETTRLTINELP